jgi:hypothetical protein
MDADSERTLTNLHIVAALSHNDKLMTNEDSFDIYSPTSFRGLFRSWYGERRFANITKIRQCVRSAIQFASKSLDDAFFLIDSANPQSEQTLFRIQTLLLQHTRMLDGLSRSRVGLANIIQTYRDDSASSSQVQLIIEEIEGFLNLMKQHTSKVSSSDYVPPTSFHQISDSPDSM